MLCTLFKPCSKLEKRRATSQSGQMFNHQQSYPQSSTCRISIHSRILFVAHFRKTNPHDPNNGALFFVATTWVRILAKIFPHKGVNGGQNQPKKCLLTGQIAAFCQRNSDVNCVLTEKSGGNVNFGCCSGKN